jgi:hypothetical protein
LDGTSESLLSYEDFLDRFTEDPPVIILCLLMMLLLFFDEFYTSVLVEFFCGEQLEHFILEARTNKISS